MKEFYSTKCVISEIADYLPSHYRSQYLSFVDSINSVYQHQNIKMIVTESDPRNINYKIYDNTTCLGFIPGSTEISKWLDICYAKHYTRNVSLIGPTSFKKLFYEYIEEAERGVSPKIPYTEYRQLKHLADKATKNIWFARSINGSILYPNDEAAISVTKCPPEFKDRLSLTMPKDSILIYPWEQKEICNSDTAKTIKPPIEYYPIQYDNTGRTYTEAPAKTNTNIEKENKKTMKMPAMNFEFGPASNDVAISPYGIAVRNNDQWLTYDAHSGQTVDVTGFTFDFKGMIYKMPVSTKDVRPGDVILHQGKPMFVTTPADNQVEAVDILNSEVKTVIPVTNMFGFNFVTKIVSLMNMTGMGGTPNPDQPFGNLMPMLMMNELMNGDEYGDGMFGNMDLGKMMMLSMMMGQGNPFANMFNFGANQNNG